MAVPVSLKDVVDHLDMTMEGSSAFLNKRTGELVILSDDDLVAIEDGEEPEDPASLPEWQREDIELARDVIESNDYVKLPDKFEIHEYSIVEDFCSQVDDDRLRTELLGKIRGSGAFRRFREAIAAAGIEEEWNRYRNMEFEKIAIRWLVDNEIPYRRD